MIQFFDSNSVPQAPSVPLIVGSGVGFPEFGVTYKLWHLNACPLQDQIGAGMTAEGQVRTMSLM